MTSALVRKIVKNVIFFGLSKGMAFVAPLLFLKFVTVENYGIVEYSYSMGAVLAIVASAGLYAAYPYFILKREEPLKKQTFLFWGFPIMITNIIALTLYVSGELDQTPFLIYLFTVIFAMQRLLSAKLKTEDKGHLAVIIDSGYYFVLASVIGFVWVFKNPAAVIILMYVLTVYAFILSMSLIWFFFKHKTFPFSVIIKKELVQVLGFSYKMIISGFIVFWLTSSARIYIKWFLGYEDVGIYSFYYRMAGIAVILYQFVAVAFFKKLYILPPKKMDNYYSIIMIIIAIGCGLCALIIPYVGEFLNSAIAFDNICLYTLLCLQMPLWVGFALCEAIIGRENVVNKFNIVCGTLVILFPLILYLFRSSLTLCGYAFLSCLLFSGAYYGQMLILRKKGIVLKKCMCLNGVFTFLAIISYTLIF